MELIRPLGGITTSVRPPDREVGFTEKLIWTALALVVYLVMGETPIFGIPRTGTTTDPFGPLRVIFASQRGTLVELCIGPIFTAPLILQLLPDPTLFNSPST